MSEVRLFDAKEWGLKPVGARQVPNNMSGETERWIDFRSDNTCDASQIKGLFIMLMNEPHVVSAVLEDKEHGAVKLRVRPAETEEQKQLEEYINSRLSDDDGVENERAYVAEQLGGLGTLLIRAAQLLQEGSNGRG